jgi:DNA polymerase-3 subunit delta
MIIRQFKILTQVRSGLDNGLTTQKIGQILKIHPFVLQKSINQVRNYKIENLKKAFNFLTLADYEYKNGGLNIETMLNILAIKNQASFLA